MVFLMCSKYSHQSNLVDKNCITNATASLTEMSIAYRVAGAYFRGKRSDKSEITHLYTCSLYLHVCCADSGILACNHRRGHSYPPIPPSCPHSQYKGYSLQSPLIQMIFNIPAPLLPAAWPRPLSVVIDGGGPIPVTVEPTHTRHRWPGQCYRDSLSVLSRVTAASAPVMPRVPGHVTADTVLRYRRCVQELQVPGWVHNVF